MHVNSETDQLDEIFTYQTQPILRTPERSLTLILSIPEVDNIRYSNGQSCHLEVFCGDAELDLAPLAGMIIRSLVPVGYESNEYMKKTCAMTHLQSVCSELESSSVTNRNTMSSSTH
jgi:hypothetical protein